MTRQQAKIPKLRFSEFSDEWQTKKLGDLCDMRAGKFLSAEKIKSNIASGLYPCYGGNGLRGFVENYNHAGNYSLVGRQGALCGNVNYVSGEFYATEHALVVYPKSSSADSKWLFYQLKRLNLNRFATGQAQPGLSVDTIIAIKQSNPRQKLEQEKIAEFLTAVDERIALMEKKLELLKKYKKGVMQKIFTQQIRFKDENGDLYPDWEEKKVIDIYHFRSTNSLSRDCLSDVGKYQNIHYGDIHKKYGTHLDTVAEDIPRIYKAPQVLIEKFIPESTLNVKDVIMADASEDYKDIGKSLEIINTEGITVAGLHTIVMRPYDSSSMVLGFGAYLFNSERVHRQIMKLATGVSVLGVSLSNLMNVKISVPSHEEQQKIVSVLTALDDKIKEEESRLEFAKQWKKGLLQRMFV